jgi:hypothetical protein
MDHPLWRASALGGELLFKLGETLGQLADLCGFCEIGHERG